VVPLGAERTYRRGMTAILEPPTVTATEAPAPTPAVRPQPVHEPVREPVREPVVHPPAAPPSGEAREPRMLRTLTPTGVRLIGAAMVALFTIGYLIEPAPDGPRPVLSLAEEIVSTVMTIFMVAALAGFLRGRRWALLPGLGFAGLLAVNIALCPATGHHQLGAWWFGQVVIGAVMVALPALALARTRAG
jgi:hypothetical protein